MTRKKAHEDHVNHERWLVSYADFITLLFAFFTVLYATAQTDQAKLEAVVNGLNAAFEGGMPIAVFSDAAMGTAAVGLEETHVTLVSDTQSLVVSMKRGLQGSLSDNVVQIGFVEQDLTVALPAERLTASAGITGNTEAEDRAVTLRIHADTPSLGGDLSDGLNKAGLLPDAE